MTLAGEHGLMLGRGPDTFPQMGVASSLALSERCVGVAKQREDAEQVPPVVALPAVVVKGLPGQIGEFCGKPRPSSSHGAHP